MLQIRSSLQQLQTQLGAAATQSDGQVTVDHGQMMTILQNLLELVPAAGAQPQAQAAAQAAPVDPMDREPAAEEEEEEDDENMGFTDVQIRAALNRIQQDPSRTRKMRLVGKNKACLYKR